MVNEFDKEIDAMLRDLAKGDVFAQTLPAAHLDADEISAFAENALPQKARLRATEHLADCSKCRKILATTISFSSEEESEIIHEGATSMVSLPAIPWYQKLFAFPNLSYVMGGVAILLCGVIGVLVFQSSQSGSMVAQKEPGADRSYNTGGGPSYEGEAPATETYASNSNAPSASPTIVPNMAHPASNSAANKAILPGAPTQPAEESSALKTGEESSEDKAKERDENVTVTKSESEPVLAKKGDAPKTLATPSANEAAETYDNDRRDNRQNEIQQKSVQDLPIQNRSTNQIMVPDGPSNRNYPPSPSPATGSSREQGKQQVQEPSKKAANRPADDSKAKDASENIVQIGNKSFRNINGIWTDTSYSGGATKTIKRGSEDYNKLDEGLRHIGKSIKQTVIVVWGGKNYKIQ